MVEAFDNAVTALELTHNKSHETEKAKPCQKLTRDAQLGAPCDASTFHKVQGQEESCA